MTNQPGSYALMLYAPNPFRIDVGKLGELQGDTGYYIYCGSAFGPGGVAARCKHHAGFSKRPHWHIDYLRRVTNLKQIWYCYDRVNREHDWSHILANYPNAQQPMPGFGSSDCHCTTHLIYFNARPRLNRFEEKISCTLVGHWLSKAGRPVISQPYS